MEKLRPLFCFAQKYAPALALAGLALVFYFSRGHDHSYRHQFKELSPSQAPSEAMSEDASFGKGGAMMKMAAPPTMALAASTAPAPDVGWLPTAHAQDNAMLIRNGNISAYVDSLKSAKQTLAEKIKKHGARVDNESQRNEYNGLILSMTIKIPAAHFQALYDDLLTLSDKINSNSINTDDITKQYVDTKSRLENKKVLQGRFRELAKRAGRVADVLEVERELARVSEDIDSTTRLLKQYETDVALSTIYLDITEPKANAGPGPAPIGFLKKIALAFKSGFDWVLDTVLEFISWWPMILIAGLGYAYYRRQKTNKKK